MRTDIATRVHLVGDDAAVAIAAERRANRQIATLEIGQERFAPRRAPAHRPANALRGPHYHYLLRMQVIARAEATADIARNDPYALRAQHLAEHVLEQHGALAAGDQRVCIVGVEPDRRARLELAIDDARDVKLVAHDTGGLRQRVLHRAGVAELVVEANRFF